MVNSIVNDITKFIATVVDVPIITSTMITSSKIHIIFVTITVIYYQ